MGGGPTKARSPTPGTHRTDGGQSGLGTTQPNSYGQPGAQQGGESYGSGYSSGDLGRPAVYMPLTREIVDHKTATLLECFASQTGKRWFTQDLFAGLMRLRGMECNADSGFAEAFYARKIVAGW